MGWEKKEKLLGRLTRYFVVSTLVPFLLILFVTTTLSTRSYNKDVLALSEQTINGVAGSISQYIFDLRQIVLLPHFSQEGMAVLEKISSKGSVSFLDKEEFRKTLDSLLASIRYTRNDYYSALVVHDDTVLYASSNHLQAIPLQDYDWNREEWYRRAVANKGEVFFLPLHVPDYYDVATDTQPRFSLVGSIRNLLSREAYAVVKIDALPSSFDRFFRDVDFRVPALIYIVDGEGNLIYMTGDREEMKERLPLSGEGLLVKVGEPGEWLNTHITRSIEGSPFVLHVLLDRKRMRFRTFRTYMVGIALYLLAFLIALYLNRRFSRRVAQPVAQMKQVLSRVKTGDFSARFSPRKSWELRELGENINVMIGDLEKTIEKTYVAQLAEKEAENKALLSQIQPHFLFNTINSLIALVYSDDPEKMESGLYSLSDLLRYVLRKENIVRLEEEIAFNRDYLSLQGLRFGRRMDWSIDIGEGCGDLPVPRLMLQPFVENAVLHGVEPVKRTTRLSVTARATEKGCHITVLDDGAGFDESKIDIMSSVGISNCVTRTKIMYPMSEITVHGAPGKGCRVDIDLVQGEGGER